MDGSPPLLSFIPSWS